jgi:hypothetical protein
MTQFCPNCGKQNTDTATACVACQQVFKRKRDAGEVVAEQPRKSDPRMLVDEVEERAWIAFASGSPPPAVHWDTADRAARVGEWADKMLAQFRSRRRPEGKDGPYR